MANLKITELDALSTQPADDDLLPIVDTSDTTDSANGTTKKIAYDTMIPDASATVYGKTKLSTAPASATAPIAVGDNDTRVPSQGENDALAGGSAFGTPSSSNKFITQDYVSSTSGFKNPTVKTYSQGSNLGDSTTRFDITNPSGNTWRYTYDGTGTDPVINSTTFPTGATITFQSLNATANNNGIFTVTASGTNYFEITRVGGTAENDKTIGDFGRLKVSTNTAWSKPTGLKYVIVELVGGGGGGGGTTTNTTCGGGGGAGGYSRKLIATASLGTTETIIVGQGGIGGIKSGGAGGTGGTTSFGSHCSATGGSGGGDPGAGVGGAGGVGSSGDINIYGQGGSGDSTLGSGQGGNSFFGGGGKAIAVNTYASSDGTNYGGGAGGSSTTSADVLGGIGGSGLILVTEYYQ